MNYHRYKLYAFALSLLMAALWPQLAAQAQILNTKAELREIRQKVDQGKSPWARLKGDQVARANQAMKRYGGNKSRWPSVTANGAPAGKSNDPHVIGSDAWYAVDGVPAGKKKCVWDGGNPKAPGNDWCDSRAAIDVPRDAVALGIAYKLTGNEAYARKVIDLLWHFLLDPDTYWRPVARNFGPHTRGYKKENFSGPYRGAAWSGYAAGFVRGHAYWNTKKGAYNGKNGEAALQEWMRAYFDSAMNDYPLSNPGNKGSKWLTSLFAAAAYLEDGTRLEKSYARFRSHVERAVGGDGSFKKDNRRANSLNYQATHFTELAFCAEIARVRGVDLWNHKGRMRRSADFLAPYLADPNVPRKYNAQSGYKEKRGQAETVRVLDNWTQGLVRAYSVWRDSDHKAAYQNVPSKHWPSTQGYLPSAPGVELYRLGSYTRPGNTPSSKPQPAPKPTNEAPSVKLVKPASGTTEQAPARFTLEAKASDADGSVRQVEFFANGTRLQTVRSAPYTYAWTNVSAGTYTLTAKATDNDGATRTSGHVKVIVEKRPTATVPTKPGSGEIVVAGVRASSHDGNGPQNTLDGERSTRWSAEGHGQWIRYELRQPATLSQVRIAWFRGHQRRMRFDVEVSSNGSSWQRVFRGQSSGSTTGLERYAARASNVRYVRIVGRGNTENDWISIADVDFGEGAPTTAPGANEVAVTGVRASSHDGNGPQNTLDGERSTRWSAEGHGQWIRYELRQPATLSQVRIAWFRGHQRRMRFDVEVSSNGSSWQRVFRGQSSGSTTGLERYAVRASNVRYVRIVGRGNTENNWISVTGVDFTGSTSAATVREASLEAPAVPQRVVLEASYPEPFRSSSTIRYALPEDTQVRLEVFNLMGRRVAVLVSERQRAGLHEVAFQAEGLPSGTYFCRLQAGEVTLTKRMTLVR